MDILQRFRLILGGQESEGTGQVLEGDTASMDAALEALYELDRKKRFEYPDARTARKGDLGTSQPQIARWLGDIRKYFPQSVVEVIQKDALAHPRMREKMLMDPEVLEQTVPDIHLVATLLELSHLMPAQTKATARRVVRKLVEELLEKLEQKTRTALTGALQRHTRRMRPRPSETDWPATIRKNLRHYQPEHRTLIPEVRIGYGRKMRRTMKELVLCLDQSGSMGTSVVYCSIFGAVLASIPALHTRLLAFDTEVADLTEALQDPVDILFGVRLGGGTDIGKVLQYCLRTIERPRDTVLVLLSDLFEGADPYVMRDAALQLHQAGVHLICLLALDDEGTPAYDHSHAAFFAALGCPVFACTPDQFPDLMAAAVEGK
jgi:hypothetical protein